MAMKPIDGPVRLKPIDAKDEKTFAHWGNSTTQETDDALRKIDENRRLADEKIGNLLVA